MNWNAAAILKNWIKAVLRPHTGIKAASEQYFLETAYLKGRLQNRRPFTYRSFHGFRRPVLYRKPGKDTTRPQADKPAPGKSEAGIPPAFVLQPHPSADGASSVLRPTFSLLLRARL
ncbi:hypothetical protein H3L91_00995 [Neisseria bacilliformis]|nr:hypothetical protein [Neisseria bacilliformis]QMT47757.1 hypothetical protein H3L91_00995 [Neisseria bacilliformis]